jgi:hypothetical protein
MLRLIQALVPCSSCRTAACALVLLSLSGFSFEARGIEMFTYFGDGSRIGLPNLEVPIEAYPGIPLRSDRIRARNRAMQMRRRGTPAPVPGQTQIAPGISIRTMPGFEAETVVPTPASAE